MSPIALQNEAFTQLAQLLAGRDAALVSNALPPIVRGAAACGAVFYHAQDGHLVFLTAEGVPAELRAYLEHTAVIGNEDFVALRALRRRRSASEAPLAGAGLPPEARSAFAQAGWKGGVAVPVLSASATLGVLLVGMRDGAVDPAIVTFLEAVAALLGAGLLQAQHHEEPPASDQDRCGGCISMVSAALATLGKDINALSALVRQICFRADGPADAGALLGMARAVDRSFQRASALAFKLPYGAAPDVRRNVPLRHVVDEAVRRAAKGDSATHSEVRVDCDPTHVIEGDRELLIQALSEVIANAHEAAAEVTPDAGAPSRRRRVSVSVEKVVDHAVIDVDDSGSGVAPDIHTRLFDPSVSTKGAGRGLGLALAQHVVESHGGHIDVGRSDLGGARFRLSLPLRSPYLEGLRRAETSPHLVVPPQAVARRRGGHG